MPDGTRKTVMVDGIAVVIDVEYQNSWDGVMQAAKMQKLANDESVEVGEKFLAVLEYYSSVIANIDEVKEALGGNPPLPDMMNVIQKALAGDETAKN